MIPSVKLIWSAICTAICAISFAEVPPVIRTAAELHAATTSKGIQGRIFELKATAMSSPPERRSQFIVEDETGRAKIYDTRENDDPHVTPGDIIILSGILQPRHRKTPEDMLLNANCTSITIVAKGTLPPPVDIQYCDIELSDLELCSVRTSGVLIDVRIDEIDPRFTTFAIDNSGKIIEAVAYTSSVKDSMDSLKRIVGATVSIEGILAMSGGTRIHRRRCISLQNAKAIHVITPPSDDIFNVPEIGETSHLTPDDIIALGRRRTEGRVLAKWNNDTILLRTFNGDLIKISLISVPPAVGECIKAVGYAETDLFHVNLINSVWHSTEPLAIPPEKTVEMSIGEVVTDGMGNRMFNARCHGKTVRLTGIVYDLTSHGRIDNSFILAADGCTITVDCENIPSVLNKLETGATVVVSGVCVAETETWNRHSTLPRTKRIFIATHSPNDIIILKKPSWWTPVRFTVAIIALATLLAVVLAWNFSLRRLSERRGRELFRNQIVRAESELRIDERTRIAAELHDHLAQNLTAIAYQLASADRSRVSAPEASSGHLATAVKMLGSCRTELRRCLWDLKSDALNEPDIAVAIRKSIEPVCADAAVEVVFPVPRSKLSDSTVHAILSISRELAANAVNHGKSDLIRVKGYMSDGILSFTVIDNGSGFDPFSAPDTTDGHFGLDGIRERLRKHNGSMSVESSPGNGCRITINMTSGKIRC